jgi:hypothetical protein
MLAISRTQPFRRFQSSVGNSTFHLNTAVVGIELVARGGTKPADLNVTWGPLKNPRDAAQQTKQFVVLATMVHLIDSFDGLLQDYADLDWLELGDSLKDILLKRSTKASTVAERADNLHRHFKSTMVALDRRVEYESDTRKLRSIVEQFRNALVDGGFAEPSLTAKSNSGEAYSIPYRAEQLLAYLGGDQADELAFFELSVVWRNALAHSSRAEARLSTGSEQRLRAGSDRFCQLYAGINVGTMLEGFQSLKRPTLKEATTMCAVTQNLARSLDERVATFVGGTPQKMEKIALRELGKSLQADSKHWKLVWRRDPSARERFLTQCLSAASITECTKAVSAPLDPGFVPRMARLAMSELEIMTLPNAAPT